MVKHWTLSAKVTLLNQFNYMNTEIENEWTNVIPTTPGNYWFYGDPYWGSMGSHFKDPPPPYEIKHYLIKVKQTGKGVMFICDGQFLSGRKFNKEKLRSGQVGYWKRIILPDPPIDTLNMFNNNFEIID